MVAADRFARPGLDGRLGLPGGSLLSLAAVALALQATLPQIAPVFQLIGDGANPVDRARNAVFLGCVLIGLTTAINAAGVRLLARINNVGVFAELVGVAVLIILLLARARRGPSVLFQIQTPGRSGSGSAAWLSAFLAAAVMPSYVLYGFDTAGTLAEETRDPRRRAPGRFSGQSRPRASPGRCSSSPGSWPSAIPPCPSSGRSPADCP